MLTNKTLEAFNLYKPWYFTFLPVKYKQLIILRWFNTRTDICVDIQHWRGDGFDYNVQHPIYDAVYVPRQKAGERTKDFDYILKKALVIANFIYNHRLKENIPYQFI